MAAGLGFKTFTTGEVLTAGDVNGYLMQGINVFASSAARAAAITSPQEGQYSFLKDTNALEYYDGAAWVGAPVGDITAVTAGTGISGGGSSGDVTITNSMATAIDAKGDLVPGTGADTFARLAVGANNTVLTADSSTATGLKWATPAGGLTLIARTTFSNVATQAFDGVFTSTYKNYLVVFDAVAAATASDKLQLQFRYSSTTQATNLYSNLIWARANAATVTNEFISNGTQANIGYNTGSSGSGFMYVSQVGNTSQNAIANGQYFDPQGVYGGSFNALSSTARTYDGFLLKSSSTNITGTVSIYGLAAA